MKIKLRTSPDQLIIYRGKTATILFVVLMTGACLAFGILFTCIGLQEARYAFLIFGGIFSLGAIFILAGLPKFLAKLKKENGAVMLMANKQGLSIVPLLNMEPVHYEWKDIAKILLTKKFFTVDVDEKQWNWNQMLIYLRDDLIKNNRSLTERSKLQLSISPKESNLFFLGFPKEKTNLVKEELTRLSSRKCEISIYEKINFNYKDKIEEFHKTAEIV